MRRFLRRPCRPGLAAAQTYPSASGITPGRAVTNAYSNGFLSAVLPYYATSITYWPNGTVANVVYAKRSPDLADGVTDIIGADPNAMARPAGISTSGATLNGQPGGDWSTGTYGYDGADNITAMGSDTFSYDPLSRLMSAHVAAYSSAESYGYDAYGNLTTYGGRSLATDPATNRLNGSGMSPHYDNAGNLTTWTDTSSGATYTLGYTRFNQLTSVSGGGLNRRLAYTADGERIVVRDGNTTMLTLRGLDGQVVSEITFDGSGWSWGKDYVYRDGLLLSSVSVAQGLRHYALDQLGSPRLVTNRCGEQVRLFAMNPFGKDPDATTQDGERMRFTIHERDLGDPSRSLDDLDAMHARSYMPFLGRFTSVDLLRGDPHSPQSFNLFAYVQGNPLNFLDPSGLDDFIPFRLRDYVNVFANYFDPGPNTVPIGMPGASPPAVGSSGFGAGVGSGETSDKTRTPCLALVPPVPSETTVASNLAQVRAHAVDTSIPIKGFYNLLWLINKVRPWGAWDYTHQSGKEYTRFGDFNYGAGFTTAGVPSEVTLWGAGAVQVMTFRSQLPWMFPPGTLAVPSLLPTILPPHGDNPLGQVYVQRGIQYVKGGC